MTAPQDPFAAPGDRRPDAPSGSSGYGTPTGSGHGQHPGSGADQPSYGHPQAGGQHVGGQQPGGQQPGGQQPGGQQYAGQPYGVGQTGRPAAPRNGLGIAALVLGLLALLTGIVVIGGLLGVVAIVLGFMGRARAKRGEATNGGMAIAGIVLGLLGLALSALVVFGVASFFGSEEVGNLTECLESAGDDTAAQQECRTDFEDEVVGG